MSETSDDRFFHYDADGNQRERAGEGLTFSWFGLPTEIETAAGDVVELGYGVDDRRVRKTVSSGKTVDYAGPGYLRVAEGGVVQHVYRVGPNIEIVRSGPRERVRWEQVDNLGSVYMMVNSGEGLVEPEIADVVEGLVSYDAFGRCVSADWPGTPEDCCAALGTPFGYTGHEHECDFDVGLINISGRMYDPALGRMLSPDPLLALGEGLNSYAYAFNSPLNYTDPSGYWGKDEKNGAVAAEDYDGDNDDGRNWGGGSWGVNRWGVSTYGARARTSWNSWLPETGGFWLAGGLSNELTGASSGGTGGDRLPEARFLSAAGADPEHRPLDVPYEGWRSEDGRAGHGVRVYRDGAARPVSSCYGPESQTTAGLLACQRGLQDSAAGEANRRVGAGKEAFEEHKVPFLIEIAMAPLLLIRAPKARVRPELPSLDRTGKVHGKLPRPKDFGRYSREELRQLHGELKTSVRTRIRRTVDLGPDRAHGQRQAAEQQLIKSIEKFLGLD